MSLYALSLSLLPRLLTLLPLLFVFCLPRLDLHTFAKGFIFLQELKVFPSAGHLLACGNSPPQFLPFVFFFGSNFDCFCRYRRLLRRLGYDFLTVFADSLSLCSISKACFSDNSNARAEESNHVRSVLSRRTLRLSQVEDNLELSAISLIYQYKQTHSSMLIVVVLYENCLLSHQMIVWLV